MTTRTKVGTGGHIAGYDVLSLTNRMLITDATGRTWDHAAPNHGTGVAELAARPGFRLGWGRFPGSGAWIATSGSNPNGAYPVSLAACECPGHEFGGSCKHRPTLAHHLGRLTVHGPEPEPDPPAPAALTLLLREYCRGRGVEWVGMGLEVEQVRVACLACGGDGEVETDEDGEPDGDDARYSAPYDAGRAAQVMASTRYRRCKGGWINPGTGEVKPTLPAA